MGFRVKELGTWVSEVGLSEGSCLTEATPRRGVDFCNSANLYLSPNDEIAFSELPSGLPSATPAIRPKTLKAHRKRLQHAHEKSVQSADVRLV